MTADSPGTANSPAITDRRYGTHWRLTMIRSHVRVAAAIVLALGAAWTLSRGIAGQSQQNVQVPKFQYDPTFRQPLPEKWAIGAIGGRAVDSRDQIGGLRRRVPLPQNVPCGGASLPATDGA